MKALILMLAAALLAGCGGGRIVLHNAADERPSELKAPSAASVFVDVEDDWAGLVQRGTYSEKKLKFERPPGAVIRESLRAELTRLGLAPVERREKADLVVIAELVELSCYPRSANTDLVLALRASAGGKPLGQRVVRGTSGPWKRRFANCKKDASAALAHALSQIGPVLDGEGWLAAAAGAPKPGPSEFALAPGDGDRRPSVLLLPVEDALGPTPLSVVFEKAYLAGGADSFQKALAAEFQRQGLRQAASRGEADWIARAAVAAFWGNIGSGWARGTVQLRGHLRLEDRSGSVLWQGVLDGKAQGIQWPEVVEGAGRAAASGLGAVLRGGTPAVLFSDAEIAAGSKAASLAPLLSAASSLSSIHSFTKNVRTLTGGADVLKKAQAGLDAAEQVRSAVESSEKP